MGPASPAVTCLSDLPPPHRIAMQSEALAPPLSPAPGGREVGTEGWEGRGKGAREEGHGWQARGEERVEPSLMCLLNGGVRGMETGGVRSRAQALARQEMRPSQRVMHGKGQEEEAEAGAGKGQGECESSLWRRRGADTCAGGVEGTTEALTRMRNWLLCDVNQTWCWSPCKLQARSACSRRAARLGDPAVRKRRPQ